MAATWTIARRQGACKDTGRPFEDGERHVSFLALSDGQLERADVCLDAWGERCERVAAGEASAPLFHWFTRHEVERKKTVQLDLESLDRLFVELEGREELAVRELRYVLCLLLMRKRRAKVEKVLREGEDEAFLVRRPKDETHYRGHVYDFESERLDQVRAQLQAVFDGAEGPCGVRLGLEDDEADGPAQEPLGETADRDPERDPERGFEEAPSVGPEAAAD